ncbi:MAG: hypothetical protein JWR10_2905, partial [Rubritepida sp.]|nr:hypothetical protein [Rubritepida sp.]
GAADPMRAAILNSAYTFNRTSPPADNARAAAMVEFLAADYRWDVRWTEFTPIAGGMLDAARDELHAAYGIAPGATPQAVVDGLYLASRSLAGGTPPALPPDVFAQPALTLARLSQPAELPATRHATSLVERELYRIDNDRMVGGGQGGSGGGGGSQQ